MGRPGRSGAGEHDEVAAAGWADQGGDGDPVTGVEGRPHAAALDEHRLQPGPAHGQAGGHQGAEGQRARPQGGCPPHGPIFPRPRCAAKAVVVVTSGGDIERKGTMRMIAERLAAWIRPTRVVHAHCDLPCGVYDPAQARIEAESMAKIVEKYHASDDEVFRDRAILIKEQRGELVKHHLWVLWTDYFKPQHLEQFPNLHDLFWQATKQAGQAKHSVDAADQQKLLDLIAEIDDIFQKSKSG
jgi:nickel superoxide dismutase